MLYFPGNIVITLRVPKQHPFHRKNKNKSYRFFSTPFFICLFVCLNADQFCGDSMGFFRCNKPHYLDCDFLYLILSLSPSPPFFFFFSWKHHTSWKNRDMSAIYPELPNCTGFSAADLRAWWTPLYVGFIKHLELFQRRLSRICCAASFPSKEHWSVMIQPHLHLFF